jgi:golgi-specific brefeldin A-resistance guanine nucleotide exchange factor 1
MFLVVIAQVLGQAVDSAAGVLLSDESICKAVQAAFMLGDPVTKPKEYGGTLCCINLHKLCACW